MILVVVFEPMRNVQKIIMYVFLLVFLFVVLEVARAHHRHEIFKSFQGLENKNQVIKQLGSPFNIYNCKTGATPSPLIYSDNMCKADKKIFEVYAFEHCRICTFFDPGWFNIGFDSEERVVDKYNIQSP